MLYERYPALELCREDIEKALSLMVEIYKKGGKVLICETRRFSDWIIYFRKLEKCGKCY